MSKATLEDVRLGDPLSEVSRNERRSLLAAGAIGIVIAKTGLIPSKITALGIEFSEAGQRSLLLVIAGIILYFLAAFLVYAMSDLFAWRLRFQRTFIEEVSPKLSLAGEEQRATRIYNEGSVRNNFNLRKHWYAFSGLVSFMRGLFDFGLPIAISGYALITLFYTRL